MLAFDGPVQSIVKEAWSVKASPFTYLIATKLEQVECDRYVLIMPGLFCCKFT